MSNEEALWRKRFAIFAMLRISGLLLFLLGMAITFSDLIRPGGFVELGLVMIGLGLADALLGPVLLKRVWDKEAR